AFSDRCGRAERGAAEAARRDGFGRSPANPNRADFRLAIKPRQPVRGNGVRGRPPFCRAFPPFPKILTPPLFLGIISLFIAASSIVCSQKYLDFWEFPKFMTPPLFLGITSLFIAASSIVHSQK